MTTPVMISLSMAWQCSNCGIVGNNYLADVEFGSNVIVATHTCGTDARKATLQEANQAPTLTVIGNDAS